MLRASSLAAYERIKREGLLPKMQFETYEIIALHGPLTARQLMSVVRDSVGDFLTDQHHKRLSELERKGVIRNLGYVDCPVRGTLAILWDITDRMPTKTLSPKKISRKALEQECAVWKQRALRYRSGLMKFKERVDFYEKR